MEFSFSKMKEAILFYKSEGMRVMPLFGVHELCQHPVVFPLKDCNGQCWGKVPRYNNWPDREFDHDHWKPGDNLALVLGRQLDGRWLMGLDIDGIFNIDEHLCLPPTLECTTQRGRHLVYEVPEDTPLGNWNDIFSTRSELLGYRWGYEGAVDIKYCRGAMTSPPSLTKSGTEYQWKEWIRPALLPEEEIRYIIRKRKFYYPHIKRYTKWSLDPNHKNVKP